MSHSIPNWHLVTGGFFLAQVSWTSGFVSVSHRQQLTPHLGEVVDAGTALRALRVDTVHDLLVIHRIRFALSMVTGRTAMPSFGIGDRPRAGAHVEENAHVSL